MNRKLELFVTLAIVGLFLSSASISVVAATDNLDGKVIVIDTTHGSFHEDFVGFVGNMTSYGAAVSIMDTTYEINDSIDVLMFADSDTNFTATEMADIKAWMELGNKTLWISGDSDYSSYYLPAAANGLLEYLGAHLRITAESISDPESNDDAAYRVMANTTGTSDIAKAITAGVTKNVFHGPTAVAGYDDGLVDLRTTDIDYVDVIMSTSAAAIAEDTDLLETEYDFYSAQAENGTYPMLVLEKMTDSFLIVSGETIFGDYKNMYSSVSEYGKPVGGLKLVDQILNFCFSGYDYPSYDDAPSFTLLTSLAAIGLFAVIVRRRR
ncbi:MAG: hypothetical protein KAR35_05055 [Candidatus Heimdallarchaeota archaeon]|nr:hypothetical protein [Candidatus Heimdallarchaeota archaeon]MCK5048725.1 hypothetical protein [Candidatus Heimdallarchaeota archaeon]